MDSRRLVVSSAASCLLSWRLAVFISLCLCLWGLPTWLACWLCEGVARFWWGMSASCARSTTQPRAQACRRGCRLCAALWQPAGGAGLEPRPVAGRRVRAADAMSLRKAPKRPP